MREPDAQRRRFLAALAAGVAAPAVARDGPRTIVYISRPGDEIGWLRNALAERGYIDGSNIRVDLRLVEADRFQALAADVVASKPEVVLVGGVERAQKMMALTRTIPIICTLGSDVVGAGLARSLNRPGYNVTGFSIEVREIAPISISLIRAMRPTVRRLVLVLPMGPATLYRQGLRPIAEAAEAAGIAWEPRVTLTLAELDRALAETPGEQTAAMLTSGIPTVAMPEMTSVVNARRVVSLAGLSPEWVEAGALMCYLRSIADKPRRMAAIIDKILRGADPGTIPFEVGDRSDLFLNRQTARLIGVTIPQEVLLRATRVVG
jgi:putative ABC transport system substrate-binding protein